MDEIPNSGNNPLVYFDIGLKNEIIGQLKIKLFRNVFPAGVENFVRIADGKTVRVEEKGFGNHKYFKETKSKSLSIRLSLKFKHFIAI